MTWIIWIVTTLATLFGIGPDDPPRALPRTDPPPEAAPARPTSLEGRLAEIARWAENGYRDDARRIARALAAEAPSFSEPLVLLARIELAGGRLGPAIEAVERMPSESSARGASAIISEIGRLQLEELATTARLDVRLAAIAALGREATAQDVSRAVEAASTGDVPVGGGRIRGLLADPSAAHARLYESLAVSERDDLELLGAAGLAAIGREDGARLAEALRGPSIGAACLAAELAREARLQVLVPAIRERSRAKDESGVAALVALAELTDDRSERSRSVRAVERAALATASARTPATRRAIEGLGEIAIAEDERCRATLGIVRATAAGHERRFSAARALARRADAQGLDDLVTSLADSGRAPSWADARAIGALRVLAAVERVRPLLEAQDPRIRAAATVAIGRLGCAGRYARTMAGQLAWARERGDDDARLELAEALYDPRGLSAAFVRPRFEPAFHVDVPAAVHAPGPESTLRVASATAAVAQILAREHEAVRIEDAAPGTALVYLRADLTPERLAALCRAARSDDYEIEPVDRRADPSTAVACSSGATSESVDDGAEPGVKP